MTLMISGLVVLAVFESNQEGAVLEVNVIQFVDEKRFSNLFPCLLFSVPCLPGDNFRDFNFFRVVDSCLGRCFFGCELGALFANFYA